MNERPLARNTDPHTSHEAPGPKVQRATIRENIITVLDKGNPQGMHDEAIVNIYHYVFGITAATPQGIRSRRAELVEDGIIEPAPGLFSKTETGRRCIVWRLVK